MNYCFETNLLNVKEASAYLKLSALTVYKYISKKKIKAIRLGGRYLINKSALNKFTPHLNISLVRNRVYGKRRSKISKCSNRRVVGAGFIKKHKLSKTS